VAVKELLVLHHSHLDIGYTHAQPIVWKLQQEFISEAVDWLNSTSGREERSRPKWTCEATEPVARWLRNAPEEDIAQFQALVEVGRIGLTALRWHICAGVDRAGLDRSIAGKAELERTLGTQIRVACQHDVNGVPWPLVDVMLDAGVDLFAMAINPHLGRAVSPRPGVFDWVGPSGRAIRVYNGFAYTMFDQLLYSWDDSVDRMAEGWSALDRRLHDEGYDLPFLFLTSTCSPVLWDNAPPNPYLPSLLERWNDAGRGPQARYATYDDLRQHMIGLDGVPVLRGDWTDYWSFGMASTPRATSLSRRGKRLLEAASRLRPLRAVAIEAHEQLDLFDEHTFGYWDTAGAHRQNQSIELLKTSLAHEGYELAAYELMDALEEVAGNAPADRDASAVLLCNWTVDERAITPQLPSSWIARPDAMRRTYRASRFACGGRAWELGFPGNDGQAFAPITMPGRSWVIEPIDQLVPFEAKLLHHRVENVGSKSRPGGLVSVAADHRPRVGSVETANLALHYDPDTGRVVSLHDRRRERELLSPRPGIDLFGFVRERSNELTEGRRYAYYVRDLEREQRDLSCWREWDPVRELPTRVISCAVTEQRDRVVLERVFEAPGTSFFAQRIILEDESPVLSVECEFELEPHEGPQAIYFALPLDVGRGWDAWFDTAGTVVAVDADQLPGACRNWATVESFAAIAGGQGGVALLTPDAPLVQFGDFHFGPPLDELPRPADPLLLAWAYNNYWDTNFPRIESSRVRLRYGLLPLDARPDLNWVRTQARWFASPPLVWPVTGAGRTRTTGVLPTHGA
jgi:alpha-mannosidase